MVVSPQTQCCSQANCYQTLYVMNSKADLLLQEDIFDAIWPAVRGKSDVFFCVNLDESVLEKCNYTTESFCSSAYLSLKLPEYLLISHGGGSGRV